MARKSPVPKSKPKPAARVRPVAKAARLPKAANARKALPRQKAQPPRKAPVESERQYLLGRRIEDVAAAFVSMTQEVWVVKDRLAVLEHVLEKHGIPAPQLVDTLAPEPALQTQLAAARRAWVESMIGALFPHGLPKVD